MLIPVNLYASIDGARIIGNLVAMVIKLTI